MSKKKITEVHLTTLTPDPTGQARMSLQTLKEPKLVGAVETTRGISIPKRGGGERVIPWQAIAWYDVADVE